MKAIQFTIVKISRVGQSPVIYIPKRLVTHNLIKNNKPYLVTLEEIESD